MMKNLLNWFKKHFSPQRAPEKMVATLYFMFILGGLLYLFYTNKPIDSDPISLIPSDMLDKVRIYPEKGLSNTNIKDNFHYAKVIHEIGFRWLALKFPDNSIVELYLPKCFENILSLPNANQQLPQLFLQHSKYTPYMGGPFEVWDSVQRQNLENWFKEWSEILYLYYHVDYKNGYIIVTQTF